MTCGLALPRSREHDESMVHPIKADSKIQEGVLGGHLGSEVEKRGLKDGHGGWRDGSVVKNTGCLLFQRS